MATGYVVLRGGVRPAAILSILVALVGLAGGLAQPIAVATLDAGGSLSSASAVVVGPLAPPSEPRNLQAVASVGRIDLTWQAPNNLNGPIVNYRIYRDTSTPILTLHAEIGNVTSYGDTLNVLPATTYFYQVSAVNPDGEGPRSSVDSVTTPGTPSAPRNLAASATVSRIDLTWQAPTSNGNSAITGYRVYQGTSPTSLVQIASLGVVLSYADTTVANNATYYYQVSAVNGVGEGPRSNTASATTPGPPGPPRNLAASATVNRIDLTWQAPTSNGNSAITGYRVYRGTSPSGLAFHVSLGVVLSYTDNTVANNATYYYQVSAVNGVGEGPRSNTASATTPGPPGPPQNLAAVIGVGRINLTWSAPASNGGSAITGYRVYRGTSPTSLALRVSLGVVFSFSDTSVSPGVTYYYQVSASNAIGEGPRSNIVSGAPPGAPTAPRNLVATPGVGRVNLTWLAPLSTGGSPISGYRIYRGTEPGSLGFLIQVGNVSLYSDTGLANGITYYYRVSAVNSVAEGPPSDLASARTPTTPSAPQGVRAIAGVRHVTLNWTAPASNGGSPIVGYRIHRGTAPGLTPFLTQVGPVLTYNDTGLTPAVVYYYHVRAVNGVGEGVPSLEVSARPIGQPSPPLNLLSAGGLHRVNLSWSPPATDGGSPVSGYRLDRGLGPTNLSVYRTLGNTLTFSDVNVTDGTLYFYQIAAVNLAGPGLPSEVTSAAPWSLPGPPVGLDFGPAAPGTIVLVWSPPASDGGTPITAYRIYRRLVSTPFALQATVPGSNRTFTDRNVAIGVPYYYQVDAVNAVGGGARSNEKGPATPVPTVDTQAPTIAIVSPAEGATLNTTRILVSGTAADNFAVVRVECSTNPPNWDMAEGTTSWSCVVELPPGPNIIYARAGDAAGNVGGPDEVTVFVRLTNGPWSRTVITAIILGIAVAVALIILLLLPRFRGQRPQSQPPRDEPFD